MMLLQDGLQLIYTEKMSCDVKKFNLISNITSIEFNEQILKFDENNDSDSNDTYNEIINEPFEKRIKQDIFRNLYQIAKSELIEKGKILDKSDEYIEEMLDILLFEDPLKLDFMKYSQENPYLFWRKTYCFDEQ